MKKKLLTLFFASSLILGACAGEETKSESNEKVEEETEEVENEAVEVDKKLINVEITFPASFLELDDEESDIEEIKKEAKEKGIKDVKRNDDGSITYTMSKSTHRKLLNEMQEAVDESIEETMNSEDFPSIKDIKIKNKYDHYEVIVDREGFENGFDGFGLLGVAFSSMYYQLFEGVNPEDYEVTMDLKDEETKEVYDTIIYPEAFEEE